MSAKRLSVVGGGVAGLAAAHRAVELARERGVAVDVQLYEARERLGGTIITEQRDGFLIEGGPDSFITQKPWGLALCKRLGLTEQLIQTNPACRRTFVVRNGVMHAIPEGFLLLAPTRILPFVTSRLFSWPGKMRMAMDLVLPRKDHGTSGDESLSDFVRRRFGREALERVAQPLVGGIYTANPDNLSLRATMPRFLDMETQHRSLILAMRKGRKTAAGGGGGGDSGARYSLFVSFERGMSTLIEALASRLPAGAIHTSTPVKQLARDGESWRLAMENGESVSADAVVLAPPAHVSAEMVRELDPGLSRELADVHYASSATMTLAYRQEQVGRLPDGFGFVVPVLENRTLIAVTLSSVKFPNRAPRDHVLMRAFLGGSMQSHVYEMSDEQLQDAVRRDLHELMGVHGPPLFSVLHRWPRSMPQYPVGHLERARRMEERAARWPGLVLAGNAFGGVGVPDCVHSAEKAVERLLGA